jgi:hypothetical protein
MPTVADVPSGLSLTPPRETSTFVDKYQSTKINGVTSQKTVIEIIKICIYTAVGRTACGKKGAHLSLQ